MSVTLTTTEIAQLKKDKARAESASATYTAGVAAQQAKSAELAVTDGAFKKFFDYYNTSIIGKYDAERRAINGQYIAAPITESDLVDCSTLVSNRITPTLPTTDIIRVAEFDGSPLVTTTTNELQHITDQATTETILTSGLTGGTFNATTCQTDAALTSVSTSLLVRDITNTFSFSVGNYILVFTGGDMALMKVTAITVPVTGSSPYTATYTISMIVAPSGTIPSTTLLSTFSGFTNTERGTKTASNTSLQPLMNYLVTSLQTNINNRISRLNEQLTAIAANQDPDGTSELTAATTNVNTSKTFLTNYLITTSISNTGITSLSTERSTRTTQTTARLTQILNAYTGRTENYFNRRYQVSNDRANTMRGTLRLQKAAESTASQSQIYATALSDQATALGRLIP